MNKKVTTFFFRRIEVPGKMPREITATHVDYGDRQYVSVKDESIGPRGGKVLSSSISISPQEWQEIVEAWNRHPEVHPSILSY